MNWLTTFLIFFLSRSDITSTCWNCHRIAFTCCENRWCSFLTNTKSILVSFSTSLNVTFLSSSLVNLNVTFLSSSLLNLNVTFLSSSLLNLNVTFLSSSLVNHVFDAHNSFSRQNSSNIPPSKLSRQHKTFNEHHQVTQYAYPHVHWSHRSTQLNHLHDAYPTHFKLIIKLQIFFQPSATLWSIPTNQLQHMLIESQQNNHYCINHPSYLLTQLLFHQYSHTPTPYHHNSTFWYHILSTSPHASNTHEPILFLSISQLSLPSHCLHSIPYIYIYFTWNMLNRC